MLKELLQSIHQFLAPRWGIGPEIYSFSWGQMKLHVHVQPKKELILEVKCVQFVITFIFIIMSVHLFVFQGSYFQHITMQTGAKVRLSEALNYTVHLQCTAVHCALKLMHGEKRNTIAKRWLKIFNVSQFISSLSSCHIYGYFHSLHCFISCRFSFVVEGRDLLNLLLVKKLLKHSTSTLGNEGWCFLFYLLWISKQEHV